MAASKRKNDRVPVTCHESLAVMHRRERDSESVTVCDK